jgi:ABC-type nickel/cobalt efflux system permease component RcnA
MSEIEVTDIGADFTPRPRDTVVGVELDGEIVIYDEEAQRMHVLNATAATVWQCLDGEVTLGALAAEIAEAYQLDVAAVEQQVIDLTRQLGLQGLLAGVRGAASSSEHQHDHGHHHDHGHQHEHDHGHQHGGSADG